ncbi:hypothetical protein NQ314_013592 [Rhamnusium bicolor]|uniref:Uncharacterized protein n=1 Tax=Rhamnusium bicolor TaxID=1586634 RepID=A0AAV8X6F3_9CUCU|nr:hypothetical protein NQ314_013592 [Rhamnusium bicolor]
MMQDSNGSTVTIEKHKIPSNSDINSSEPGPSQSLGTEDDETKSSKPKKNWESFENEDKETEKKEGNNIYEGLREDWETFDEDDEIDIVKRQKSKEWEKFEEDDTNKNQMKNLQLELAFAENPAAPKSGPMTSISGVPLPLFSDLPVNNNNTYSYDILEQQPGSFNRPAVFMPTTIQRKSVFSSLELLQQPTFYKSLLLVITTKFSIFVYFTLFPTYLFQELEGIKMRHVSTMVGVLSLTSLLFSMVSYWVNIDKKRRPICLWFLCWVGSFGYFSK